MSHTSGPGDRGRPDDPQSQIGSGKPARRRIGALFIAVVLGVFIALLTIWLLGRSADDVQGAAADRPTSGLLLTAWPTGG